MSVQILIIFDGRPVEVGGEQQHRSLRLRDSTPRVYNHIHISGPLSGNVWWYGVVFAMVGLRRCLSRRATMEDKIINKANEEGVSLGEEIVTATLTPSSTSVASFLAWNFPDALELLG